MELGEVALYTNAGNVWICRVLDGRVPENV